MNPPAGAILHVAGEAEGGIVVSEIWQTEQTFRAYLDYRLRPALRMHGVHGTRSSRSRRCTTVHAVEMDTIERLGRSLATCALRGCGALLERRTVQHATRCRSG